MDQRGLLRAAQEIVGVNGHALGENARDIEAVGAFGNHHRIEIHIPDNQFPVNINGAQGPVEEVFTRFQPAASASHPVSGEERPPMGKHAAGNKKVGDGGGARAGSEFPASHGPAKPR